MRSSILQDVIDYADNLGNEKRNIYFEREYIFWH